MSLFRTLFLTILLPLQANACLQVDGTTLDGGRIQIGGPSPAKHLRSSLKKSPKEKSEKLIRSHYLDDFSQKEIEGVQEVLAGNYDHAISIFEQSEIDEPGRYSTAANLGTAYELKGKLDLALKWISEGIRRNPESHLGTEWLHVEILKTRIKLTENPAYLRQNRLIKLPEAYSSETMIQVGEKSYTIDQIAHAIHYQLLERMIFVKPPDPVVADLLFTFGEIEGRTEIIEYGIELFEMAKEYGFADSELIDKEMKHFQWVLRKGMIWRVGRMILASIAFIIFLIFAYRKKWFFLRRSDYLKHQAKKHLNSAA